MSIESFLRNSIPSPQFKQVLIESHSGEVASTSLINILAGRFIKAGTECLRQVSKELTDSSIITDGFGSHKESVLLNKAAILLGTTIITIEDALVEKSIDYGLLWGRFNEAVVGTIVKPYQITEERVRPLSSEEWWQMIQLVEEDKTLSNFFIKQNPVRDYLLNKVIVDQPAIPFICGAILPKYRELAQSLVGVPATT